MRAVGKKVSVWIRGIKGWRDIMRERGEKMETKDETEK